MRVLISVDMEGVGGVVDREEVLVPAMTERARLIPGAELVGDRVVGYQAPDFPMAYRITQLVAMLGSI
jgi:D-aminopeptidase